MEFLYSLNRLNVATSRAQAVVIVVGSPRLLEPECRSPRQMQLANALCRYAEIAQVVEMPSQETVEIPTHVTRELFGADIGGATKEHPSKGL